MKLLVEMKPRNTDSDAHLLAPNRSSWKLSQQQILIWIFYLFFKHVDHKKRQKQQCISVIHCYSAPRSLTTLLWQNTYEITAACLLPALPCSAVRCNLVSARGLHMILTPRSARLVPRELTRAPPSARFKEDLACVGKCGSVSVQTDSHPAWELLYIV